MEKKYYKIGEVSAIIKENVPTIRNWTQEFKQLNPVLSKKGTRLYTPRDIEILFQIRFYLRTECYTLEGAKKKLGAPFISDAERRVKVINRLKALREELMSMRREIRTMSKESKKERQLKHFESNHLSAANALNVANSEVIGQYESKNTLVKVIHS